MGDYKIQEVSIERLLEMVRPEPSHRLLERHPVYQHGPIPLPPIPTGNNENHLERLEVRSGRPGTLGWEWGLGVNTREAGEFVQSDLDWVSNKTYRWTLIYDGQGAGTLRVFDKDTHLFSRNWNVPGKPLRVGNALKFHVRARDGIAAGNLITVTVTSINGTAVNRTLKTDGSGAFSQQAVHFAGTSLSQGFKVQGTVKLTFTDSYAPLGSRLDFTVTAGNVTCAQASQPTTEIAYIWADHLNTPRTVTDVQQQAIWKWDNQDPFGANVPS
jgi:hypothetical protein